MDLNNPYAMSDLAALYAEGDGVEQDLGKALEYTQKAADLGVAEAYTCLGDFYSTGTGVEQDREKAAEYYRKAVELGDENAAEKLKSLTEGEQAPAKQD